MKLGRRENVFMRTVEGALCLSQQKAPQGSVPQSVRPKKKKKIVGRKIQVSC